MCYIEGECAFKGFVCQEEGVLATWAKHVEGGVVLGGESAPVGDGEGLWEPYNP